jgi:hypothetical protein
MVLLSFSGCCVFPRSQALLDLQPDSPHFDRVLFRHTQVRATVLGCGCLLAFFFYPAHASCVVCFGNEYVLGYVSNMKKVILSCVGDALLFFILFFLHSSTPREKAVAKFKHRAKTLVSAIKDMHHYGQRYSEAGIEVLYSSNSSKTHHAEGAFVMS